MKLDRPASFLLVIALALGSPALAQSLGDLKKVLNTVRQKAQRPTPPTQARSAPAEEPAAQPDGAMMLWVERNYGTWDNPLHSELSINGTLVDIFTGDTFTPVDRYLTNGWNTVTIRTTPQEPANDANDLIFRIGPARRDPRSKRIVMSPVLWQFRNGTDWKMRDDGTWRHALGPKVKEVELSFQLFFTGLENELREIDEGDIVLIGTPNYNTSWNTSVSGTVFVNGTPVNSFLQPERQVVITPYLKKGKNEIKLVSARVNNSVEKHELSFVIAGPARWSATDEKYVLRPILQFSAMQGWVRDSMSGRLVNRVDPKSETIERVIPLLIKDDEPGE